MDGPDVRFALATRRAGGAGVVLLHPHIPHHEASRPQRTQQLVAVVLQRLQPRPRRRTHGQQALQLQGTAMGSQLGAGDPGPFTPQPRQVAVAAPVLLEMIETTRQGAGRRPGGGISSEMLPTRRVCTASLILRREPLPSAWRRWREREGSITPR